MGGHRPPLTKTETIIKWAVYSAMAAIPVLCCVVGFLVGRQ